MKKPKHSRKTKIAHPRSLDAVVRREAQIYNGETYVRIFKKDVEGDALADINVPEMEKATVDNADAALAQLGLRRRTNWRTVEWGFVAEVTHHA